MIPIVEYKQNGELHHFSGYYMDLDTQRVWSAKRGGRWLKTSKRRNGYVLVRLYDTNAKRIVNITLSRLVWTIANGRQIPDGYDVNHIDEDKTNNHPSNLNIMTRKENNNWGTRNARMAAALRGRKQAQEVVARRAAARSKAVAQLTLDGRLVQTWPSTSEAGRNGWVQQTISKCCRGELKTHGGYRWQWLDDYQTAPVAASDGQLLLAF